PERGGVPRRRPGADDPGRTDRRRAGRRSGVRARQLGLQAPGGGTRGDEGSHGRSGARRGDSRRVEGARRLMATRHDGPVTPIELEDDGIVEAPLRPRTLDEYVGQEPVRENLRVQIEAARARGDVLDHVLLCGPPGLGKTSLATVVANELAVGLRTTSGPV